MDEPAQPVPERPSQLAGTAVTDPNEDAGCSTLPGSKLGAAFEAFREPLQQALSCITYTPLSGRESRRRTVGEKRTLTFPGDPAPLSGSDLALTVSFEYEIYDTGERGTMRYRCRTLGYKHQVVTSDFNVRTCRNAHTSTSGQI